MLLFACRCIQLGCVMALGFLWVTTGDGAVVIGFLSGAVFLSAGYLPGDLAARR